MVLDAGLKIEANCWRNAVPTLLQSCFDPCGIPSPFRHGTSHTLAQAVAEGQVSSHEVLMERHGGNRRTRGIARAGDVLGRLGQCRS